MNPNITLFAMLQVLHEGINYFNSTDIKNKECPKSSKANFDRAVANTCLVFCLMKSLTVSIFIKLHLKYEHHTSLAAEIASAQLM